VQKYNLHYIIV